MIELTSMYDFTWNSSFGLNFIFFFTAFMGIMLGAVYAITGESRVRRLGVLPIILISIVGFTFLVIDHNQAKPKYKLANEAICVDAVNSLTEFRINELINVYEPCELALKRAMIKNPNIITNEELVRFIR